MSRPCFALSVMLSCMAGPLLIIGKTHAQDPIVSPSHSPGDCIVCPLVHGPLQACGAYSDYDYNKYWYDEYSPPASEATTPTDPELETAQALTAGVTEEAWESDYDDYYADYVYGDDTTSSDAEDLTLEETPAPAALIDTAPQAAPTRDVPEAEGISEPYDEFGWYTDDVGLPGEYLDSYDGYEPIDSAAPSAASPEEAAEAGIDYEAYEEEWFSYGGETSDQAQDVNSKADEAYAALSESASETCSDEIIAAQPTDENWGDEEAWYREEYGYDGALEEAIEESAEFESAEQLETGYDEAYDEAMATDLEGADQVADIVPANPEAESPEADDYESFYDAYDDLYNFESTSVEPFGAEASIEPETSDAMEAAVEELQELAEPAWLSELVNRMLAPIRTAAAGIASSASILEHDDSHNALYVDECAHEWDCESDYWAQPQPEPEQPSVVLGVADTLDGMAAVLQNAAELLRGVAGERLAETAQASNGGATR